MRPLAAVLKSSSELLFCDVFLYAQSWLVIKATLDLTNTKPAWAQQSSNYLSWWCKPSFVLPNYSIETPIVCKKGSIEFLDER